MADIKPELGLWRSGTSFTHHLDQTAASERIEPFCRSSEFLNIQVFARLDDALCT